MINITNSFAKSPIMQSHQPKNQTNLSENKDPVFLNELKNCFKVAEPENNSRKSLLIKLKKQIVSGSYFKNDMAEVIAERIANGWATL